MFVGIPSIPFLLSQGALSPGTSAPRQAQERPVSPPAARALSPMALPVPRGTHVRGMEKTVSGHCSLARP